MDRFAALTNDNCLSPVSPIQLPVLRQGQPPVSVHATTQSCHAILGPCHTARGSPQISRREIGTLVHKDHKKQPALRIFANQTAVGYDLSDNCLSPSLLINTTKRNQVDMQKYMKNFPLVSVIIN